MKEMYNREELLKLLVFPVRDYKDRIFRMIFKIRKQALELYNALNGTDYTNEDDLEITTLENAIYLGMKNDVSFVLYDQLMLYEHHLCHSQKQWISPLMNVFGMVYWKIS